MEKTCKTCINLCNKKGEVCNLYKGEVQEMIKEIDKKLTVEEAVRIIQEEGYYDFERNEIGGNMIEVGEYVRFKDGSISRVTECRYAEEYKKQFDPNNRLMRYEKDKYWLDNKMGCKTDINIKKHSKNIIDLIEVGDYVNGYKVVKVTEHTFTTMEQNGYKVHHKECVSIKTILTKEQYEDNCYKVKEE